MRLFAIQVNSKGALALDWFYHAPLLFRTTGDAKLACIFEPKSRPVCVSLTKRKTSPESRLVWVIIAHPGTPEAYYTDNVKGAPLLYTTRKIAEASASIFDGDAVEKRYLTVVGEPCKV